MTSETICNLEKILLFPGKIINYNVSRLTAPAENYGSLLLKVDLTVETSQTEDISIVAKAVPSNEETQKIFNTEKTFRNEIAFYRDIIPILQNFQKQHEFVEVIDLFPKYYGSRLNLNCDESRVDHHGVVLLENLEMMGYDNIPRTQGFDLETAKLVISDLTQFHAVPLALWLQENEIFHSQIFPHLLPWKISIDIHNKVKEKLKENVEQIPNLGPLQDRILTGFDKRLIPSKCREPYVSVVHNDFWCNNIMIKFENGKPIKTKIVDLQECVYGSLAKDIIFFLFSNVKIHILENHYDELIQVYYQRFMQILKDLKCDLEEFSYDGFLKELDCEAQQSLFGQVVWVLYTIFRVDSETECSLVDLLKTEITEPHKERQIFIVKEFAQRN